MAPTPVRYGLDMLLSGMVQELLGQKVGLVTNNSATTGTAYHDLLPIRQALGDAGVDLAAVFLPEADLVSPAETPPDVASATERRDPVSGAPLYPLRLSESLSADLSPRFQNLDVVLFDLPDVGSRFYDHVWILSHVMEACAQAGKPLWVLDRPNPLSGNLLYAEGPILDESLSSSVGRWPIPVRHCLTMGELAWLWRVEREIAMELNVVKMGGWERGMFWPEIGNPFVPASTYMPSFEAALLYPGTGLFEGTNVSVGRGTATPFCQIGAPWIDSLTLSQRFNSHDLFSVSARPVQFVPTRGRYAGEVCHGVMLHPLSVPRLFPVKMGLWLLADLAALFPDHFEWLPAAQDGSASDVSVSPFDHLIGQPDVQQAIVQQSIAQQATVKQATNKEPGDLPQLIQRWTQTPGWVDRVLPYLLYAD